MDIKDFLSPDHVIVDMRAPDKTRLLKDLCVLAAGALKLEPEAVSGAILKREQLGSTGVGAGVAIPHARIEGLKAPFGLLARLKAPVEFDAIDGARVDLVFLLLLPAVAAGDQLNALAAVARRLRDPKVAAELRRAGDAESLYSRIIAPA
jgi:nitrogen PTS system EIIA component